jgi:uncharacterized protein YcfJ
MQRTVPALLLVYLWGMTDAAAAAFRSYATVLDVQPIVETWYEPVTRTVCTDPDAAAREFTGVATTIGADIRGQITRWQAQRSCRTVTERQPRERVTAYRVTYSFRGHAATTQLSHHPGERLPVNISLSPLPD